MAKDRSLARVGRNGGKMKAWRRDGTGRPMPGTGNMQSAYGSPLFLRWLLALLARLGLRRA